MPRDDDSSQRYTMDKALKEASELLQNQFGKVDQSAAVQLATSLYTVHARDEFLRENTPESEMAYGGGGQAGH